MMLCVVSERLQLVSHLLVLVAAINRNPSQQFQELNEPSL